jgi:CDP-2,3-bis-(O-geranylgeranyl)-sn-glycerol synthase
LIKRRLGIAPSSEAGFLDQMPEVLFPGVLLMHTYNLDSKSIIILVCMFVIVELMLSPVFFKLGIRNRPY